MCEYNIGEALTELRKTKGVTQEELANALSVSGKTVSKWETGASAPDLAALAAIARYYNVSTDAILGLGGEKRSLEDVLKEQFDGLSRPEAALRAFDISRALFPASYDRAGYGKDDIGPVLPTPQEYPQCRIQVPELYSYSVSTDDVNLSVLQLRNKSNFAWLTDEKAQEGIHKLLSFLSDPDAMRLMALLHSSGFENDFYAERAAEAAGLPLEKTVALLDAACEIPDLCDKTVAHLLSGERTIYFCQGNGMILSLLSLAHAAATVSDCYGYEWNYGGGGKMIGG